MSLEYRVKHLEEDVSRLSPLKNKFSQLFIRIGGIEHHIDVLDQQITFAYREHDDKLIALTAQVGALEQHVHHLTTEVQEVRNDVNSLRKEVRGDVSSLREEVHGDVNSLRSEVNGRFDTLEQNVQELLSLLKKDS